MAAIPNMEPFLGKNINQICGNGLHDPKLNHCAHFVSHAVGLAFPFNCRQLVGGKREPANIRVHEVFAMCPLVGIWQSADKTKDQLNVYRARAHIRGARSWSTLVYWC
jgi:hypothetical protein